jgi:N-acetylneuraminic acid mutarotase
MNGKVYIGFGSKPNPSLIKYGDLWEYNAGTNSWTEVNTSAVQGDFTFNPIAFTAGGKGYFLDLHNATDPYTTILWEFDAALSSWTRKADLPDHGTRGPDTTIAGHGLVVCDENGLPRVYEYDPANNIWIRRQTLQAAIAPLKFIGVTNSKAHLGGTEVWELSFD